MADLGVKENFELQPLPRIVSQIGSSHSWTDTSQLESFLVSKEWRHEACLQKSSPMYQGVESVITESSLSGEMSGIIGHFLFLLGLSKNLVPGMTMGTPESINLKLNECSNSHLFNGKCYVPHFSRFSPSQNEDDWAHFRFGTWMREYFITMNLYVILANNFCISRLGTSLNQRLFTSKFLESVFHSSYLDTIVRVNWLAQTQFSSWPSNELPVKDIQIVWNSTDDVRRPSLNKPNRVKFL